MNVLPDTPGPAHTPPVGVAVSNTIVSVKHTRIGALVKMTLAPGFTVIVNVLDGPVQLTPPLVIVAVTVIVATTGEVVGLIATKLGILPTPLAPRPIVVLLLVQLNTAPVTLLPNVIAAVFDPLHTV